MRILPVGIDEDPPSAQHCRDGGGALSGCRTLSEALLGETHFGDWGGWCFHLCRALATVTLPPSLETVGDYAFYECGGLTIGLGQAKARAVSAYYSLEGCVALAVAVLPPNLESIGHRAFAKCKGWPT
jgi:hypothetical protein